MAAPQLETFNNVQVERCKQHIFNLPTESCSRKVFTAVAQSSSNLRSKPRKNVINPPRLVNTHLVCPRTPLERHLLHVICMVFRDAARSDQRGHQVILDGPELRRSWIPLPHRTHLKAAGQRKRGPTQGSQLVCVPACHSSPSQSRP